MSFVTYSNESKTELLGVSENLINSFGVVSEEVALKMAYGVSMKSKAKVGVGISGIAGPTGATENKPIGMVCFGFYINGMSYSVTKYFGDIGRNNVRNLSVAFVLDFLNSVL
jgi:nicotinamide-nucleotide amidase